VLLFVDWKRDGKCPICAAAFRHYSNLIRHMSSVHKISKVQYKDEWVDAPPSSDMHKGTKGVKGKSKLRVLSAPSLTTTAMSSEAVLTQTVTATDTVVSCSVESSESLSKPPASLFSTPSHGLWDESESLFSPIPSQTCTRVRSVTAASDIECSSPLPSEPVAVSVSDVGNVPMTTATAADPVRDNAEAVVTDYESDTSSASSVPVKRPHTSFTDQGVTSETITVPPTTTSTTEYIPSVSNSLRPLAERDLIMHFVDHPEDDGYGFLSRLSSDLSSESVSDILSKLLRIKNILSFYATSLIMRRAQAFDRPHLAPDPDLSLIDHLVAQSGHKVNK